MKRKFNKLAVVVICLSVFLGSGQKTMADFNVGTGFNNTVHQATLQADGKILVAGDSSSFNGNAVPDGLLRLNSDSTLDTAFNTNLGAGFTGFADTIYATEIQSDGKILVAGVFTSLSGSTTIPDYLLRLNSDGTLDTTFNTNLGTGFDATVFSTSVQSDGKILVAGFFTSFNGNSAVPDRLLRLNSDGTLDTTFNTNLGTGFNFFVWPTTVQSDGKILVGGGFTTLNGSGAVPDRLLRLNSDGTLDTTFNTNIGTGFDGTIYAIATSSGEKVLLGGNFTTLNGSGAVPDRLLRLNSDGTLDTTFNTNIGTGFDLNVYSTTAQSDGKIIAGGDFTTLNGNSAVPDRLLRLNSDGTLDTTFNTNIGTGFDGTVEAVTLQSDGKIILAGDFVSLNGNSTPTPDRLVRLNSDGTLDLDSSPVITILGSNPASVTQGNSYTDAGATALDAADGTLTSSIGTTGTVNTAIVASYNIVYSVTDNNANTAYATRTVSVVAASGGGGGGGGGGSSAPLCKKIAPTTTAELKGLAVSLTKNLSLNAKDPAVITLKKFLKASGCKVKKVDDLLDKDTVKVLKSYQKVHGIKVTGVFDAATMAYIKGGGTTPAIPTKVVNKSEQMKLLESLLAQIALLKAELQKRSGSTPQATVPNKTIRLSSTPNLSLGTEHPIVKELQRFLNESGFIVASSGSGSSGFESTLFGERTKAALIKFQLYWRLAPTGIYDTATQALVAEKYHR